MNDKIVFILALSLVFLVSLVGIGNTLAQSNTNGTFSTGANMTNSTGLEI